MANQKNPPACSFCSRTEDQINLLIPGPRGVYICDHCVQLCYELVEEYTEKSESKTKKKNSGFHLDYLPRPAEIKARLDEYVVGQDKAKTALSVAVYNHYKRLM